jgi:hypothetical protein
LRGIWKKNQDLIQIKRKGKETLTLPSQYGCNPKSFRGERRKGRRLPSRPPLTGPPEKDTMARPFDGGALTTRGTRDRRRDRQRRHSPLLAEKRLRKRKERGWLPPWCASPSPAGALAGAASSGSSRRRRLGCGRETERVAGTLRHTAVWWRRRRRRAGGAPAAGARPPAATGRQNREGARQSELGFRSQRRRPVLFWRGGRTAVRC